MPKNAGDRLIIGALVLMAFFAVFVTASGQSAEPRLGHCPPHDPDCYAYATLTPTPTHTPTPEPDPPDPPASSQSIHT